MQVPKSVGSSHFGRLLFHLNKDSNQQPLRCLLPKLPMYNFYYPTLIQRAKLGSVLGWNHYSVKTLALNPHNNNVLVVEYSGAATSLGQNHFVTCFKLLSLCSLNTLSNEIRHILRIAINVRRKLPNSRNVSIHGADMHIKSVVLQYSSSSSFIHILLTKFLHHCLPAILTFFVLRFLF